MKNSGAMYRDDGCAVAGDRGAAIHCQKAAVPLTGPDALGSPQVCCFRRFAAPRLHRFDGLRRLAGCEAARRGDGKRDRVVLGVLEILWGGVSVLGSNLWEEMRYYYNVNIPNGFTHLASLGRSESQSHSSTYEWWP